MYSVPNRGAWQCLGGAYFIWTGHIDGWHIGNSSQVHLVLCLQCKVQMYSVVLSIFAKTNCNEAWQCLGGAYFIRTGHIDWCHIGNPSQVHLGPCLQCIGKMYTDVQCVVPFYICEGGPGNAWVWFISFGRGHIDWWHIGNPSQVHLGPCLQCVVQMYTDVQCAKQGGLTMPGWGLFHLDGAT
jgi:hypothetical protein